MTKKHREGSGGDEGSYLYVSVTHHLLRSPDGPEVITHAKLRVSHAEQIVAKAVRKPIQVAIVFFFIFFWIDKNQRCSYSSRDIVIMTVILAATVKRFRRYHRSDKTVPCERFSHFKGNNIQDILLLFQSNYLTIFCLLVYTNLFRQSITQLHKYCCSGNHRENI